MEFYGVIRICCSHICWRFLKYHELKPTWGFMRHFENSEAWSAGSQDFCTLPHLMSNWIIFIFQFNDWMCHENPWNPNRMMYAVVKWSRPFFASIAKCGSMAQHSVILGRSIGWIRTSCGFEDVRRVEMDWDGFFVSLNDFHHCQHESPSKRIGRVNVQVAGLVVFPDHFTMIGKFWFCLIQCRFIPLVISTTLRWADHEIGKKHRKAVRRDMASSRELSVSNLQIQKVQEKDWANTSFFRD